MEHFILLHAEDNVVIALKNLNEGDLLSIRGADIKLLDSVRFGHKIAVRPIARNAKVLKYGLPIGSATRDIQAGEHVHVHNLESDYKMKNTE